MPPLPQRCSTRPSLSSPPAKVELIEPLFPNIPSLPRAPRVQIPGGGCGGVQAQETASKIWNSSLGIPIKTAQNRRGKLLLALRSQFR